MYEDIYTGNTNQNDNDSTHGITDMSSNITQESSETSKQQASVPSMDQQVNTQNMNQQTNTPDMGKQTEYQQSTYSQPTYQQQIYGNTYQNHQSTGNTNTGYAGGQQYHTSFQTNRNQASNSPRHTRKSGSGFFTKAIAIVCSAVVFGCIAGGTMVGVNYIASSYLPKYSLSDNSVSGNSSSSKTLIGAPETQAPTTQAETSDNAVTDGVMHQNSEGMDVSNIVDKAMPSVVAIHGTETVEGFSLFGQQSYEADASGSGIIIGENDAELLVVTNNHVVDGISNLSVTFNDDNTVYASVKGRDSESDIAILAVNKSDISDDTMKTISIASIGNSDDLKVGQGVIAIGNALGYGQSVTVGYVSALNREVKVNNQTTRNLLQTDAAINPGNSGGALLNMQGQVIGINSAKYSSTEVEGIGYAIPISTVQDIIENLSSKTTRSVVTDGKQGYIGIQGQNIDDTMSEAYDMPKGIYVYKILPDGAAAQSTLQEKDIITQFDDQSVSTMAELKDMLTYYSGGDTVTLTVQRLNGSKYEEQKIDVTLGLKSSIEQN